MYLCVEDVCSLQYIMILNHNGLAVRKGCFCQENEVRHISLTIQWIFENIRINKKQHLICKQYVTFRMSFQVKYRHSTLYQKQNKIITWRITHDVAFLPVRYCCDKHIHTVIEKRTCNKTHQHHIIPVQQSDNKASVQCLLTALSHTYKNNSMLKLQSFFLWYGIIIKNCWKKNINLGAQS